MDFWHSHVILPNCSYEMLYGKSPFLNENPNIMYGKIIEEEPTFSKDMKYSDESTDLIKRLLKKSNSDRIGYDDEQEIFTHPWFNNIDFAKLIAKKLSAMIIPCVENRTPLQKSRSKHQEDGSDGEEENKYFALDLSFENEKVLSNKKLKGANDSMEDFSYFEEEGWVETAIDDDDILLEEFKEERRVQLLTNIEEYSECSMDEDNQKRDRDALRSPPGESRHSNSETDEKDSIRRKGSVDSQIDEYNKSQKDKDNDKSEKNGTDLKATGGLKKCDSSDNISDSNAKSIKMSPSQIKREVNLDSKEASLSPILKPRSAHSSEQEPIILSASIDE